MKKLIVFMLCIPLLVFGQSIERMPKIFTNSVYFAGPLSFTATNGALDLTITNTVAAGDRAIQANITQSTNALTGTLDAIYARATGYAANSSAGRVQGAEIGARLPDADGTKAISEVVGTYTWADAKIGTVATLRGFEASLDGGAGSTSTLAVAFEAFNNSSGTQTASYAFDVNEGSPTGRKAFTADFRGQNGETISNATNGYWTISATRILLSGILETTGNAYFGSADGYTSSGTTIGSAGTISAKGAIVGDAAISAGTSFNPDAAGGAALGTTALEFTNLFLTDGGIVYFGADQDVTLTHVADTGLLLNAAMKLEFRDATEIINSSADGQLDIDATTEVEITTGTLDLNGALDISGATTSAGTYDATALSSTVAGGDIGADVEIFQTGTALTGDLIGIKGNARVDVESASGKVIGGYFLAGNSDAGGFGLDIARGVYAGVTNKVPAAASVTWNTARGYEVSMDLDQGTSGHTTTITNAQMFYGVYNLPTSGTYATVTNGYGVYLKNEAVGGTGQTLDAALYVADASMSGGIKGWDYGVDLSGVAAGYTISDIKLSSGAKIFTGSAANGDAVYTEVGAKDAIGSIYLNAANGYIYIQVANAGQAADWYKVTATDVD